LVNYARLKPDIALKALPILVADMEDSNPLMRALALRTISYIHVREFVEAAIRPVRGLLRDADAYVRKTACFAIAKLYDHEKLIVENTDLISGLNSMLRDENQTVVSSALASLVDIWERSEAIKLTIDYASASKIVSILADCSECVLYRDSETVADLQQMGSDLHPRGDDELHPTRYHRGDVSRRALKRGTEVGGRGYIPVMMVMGTFLTLSASTSAVAVVMQQALPTAGHIAFEGPRDTIPRPSQRPTHPPKTTRNPP